MPGPKTQTLESGADAGSARADDGRSGTGTQRSGATDGITITRWSLGLSLMIALTVVTAAFTLVWEQTATLGERQVQFVAHVGVLDGRMSGLETRMSGLETRMSGLETRMTSLETRMTSLESEVREEISGLREEIRGLADLIRAREPGPPAQ